MKVKDLIAELSKLDPELLVVGFSEDSDVLEPCQAVRLFELRSVEACNVEFERDEARKPRIRFSVSGEGRPMALLELTTTF